MIMKMFHSGNLSGAFSIVENCKKNSIDSIPVVQKSAIEKPTNDIINPCKILPNCDVVGQETSRPLLVEIVDLKSANKSIEVTSSTSTLGVTKQRKQLTRARIRAPFDGKQISLNTRQSDTIDNMKAKIDNVKAKIQDEED
jgi:hypothetical protein